MAQFNDLLVLGKANIIGAIKSNADHDFLNHTNEFTFASPAHSGDIYINHRTASGLDGNITAYRFRNGNGAEANIYASTFYGTFSGTASSATALTTSAGSTGQPVYFSAGKPVAIDWHIGNKDVGEHDANNVTYNFSGYYTSNGPATTIGATTNDGSLWAQAYNATWVTQIAQDYRDGGLFVRGKNSGTWTAWKQIPMLDGLSAGNSSLPVYVDAGIVKACGTSLAVSITGNATTATTATYIATSKASDNAARHVYFAYNGDSVGKQRVVVDDDFKYNPSTNTLLSVGLEGKKILLKDTSTAGNGLIMYRGAATTDEALRINVDANNGTITNTNETLQSVLNLVLKYDDTSHTGAGAGSQTVVFKGTASGSEITATKFNGALNGNASTASKWSSAKNFTIRDSYDAYSASTAVGVDGSGAVTLKLPQSAKFAETNTNLISGQAYPEGSSKYYHKVATISHDLSTSGQINTALTLLVTGYYGSCNAINGLLKAEMRWDTDKTAPGFANLHWITASSSVTPENFILAYSIAGTVVTVNLYVYMGSSWTSLNFTKLSEHNWGNSTNIFKWQFIKATKSATSYLFTAIPETETQVPSVIDKIKNNSATADALTSSNGSSTRPVYFSSGKPVAISYLASAYGGTGVTSHTANRLVWSKSATEIQAGYHYANATKVAINHTSEPSFNFQVNGTSHFAGNVTGSGTIQIKMAEAAIKTSIADGTNIVGLYSATNRGLYDFTSGHWIIYKRAADSTIRVPNHFYMDGGATVYGALTIRNESSKPAAGTDIPLLKASYQNSGGSYYTTDVISVIGTGETGTTINNACLRIGSTSGSLALTAGESGKSMISNLALTNHENIDLITDAAIRTYVGCANDGTSYVKGPYITSTGITFYDTNEVANASTSWTNGTASTTEGTKGTQGYFNLTLGNATAISSTLGSGAGNSRGRIYMYGTGKYYTAIVSAAESSHKTVTIPNYTGNAVISVTSEQDPTTAATYNIPFYLNNGSRIGYNESLRYKTLEGTTTAEGYGRLYLGNATATGTAGNKSGGILIYSSNTSYQQLLTHPNASNGTTAATSRTTYLRDYGNTGYLVATTTRNAVGSASLPVYISTSGVATACTASSLFSAFSSSGNTLSITVAGQTRTAAAVNSVSNTWAAGTASEGPSIKTTVNGVAGTAVRIPVATNAVCGATKVYKAADCTEFTDDTYALTCAAVQKSFNYFGWGLRTRGTQFSTVSITNLNTKIDRGNYYANNSTQAAAITNGPTTSSGYRLIEQEGYNGTSSGYGRRFAFGSGEAFYYQAETSTRGSWNPWRQIIHTGNFTTHLDDTYVNESGDSMTGTLSWGGNIASLNFRTGHDSYDGVISYQTSGNEAMLFTTKNAVTSFMFVNGEDTITNMAADRWTKITPGLQIKNNCVAIGKLIANGITPSYKLDVNGTANFSGHLYANSGLTWTNAYWIAPGNITCTKNGTNAEFSFDMGAGTQWHVWSTPSGASMLSCFADTKYVQVHHHLQVGSYNNSSYALTTDSFICNSWIRTTGNTGWYNESYGGGWYMTDNTYIRAYNGKMVYSSGRYLSETVPSSWLAGQNANNGAYNVNDYSNEGSYNPWMRAKNTHANVKKYFSFGTLGKHFYWIGSTTDRTENGYDKGMSFNVESGLLYAPIVGGDRIYTGYDSGQTGSVSCSNWFRSNGDSGWYNASHDCHVMPNIYSSYGSVCIRGGAKGGYEGLHFGSNNTGLTVMSIMGSHQGLYNQSKTGWIIYTDASNGLIGVGGSAVNSGYKVTISGNTYNSGSLYMANNNISGVNSLHFADPGPDEGITWDGGNGWKIQECPDDLSNAAGNLQFMHGSTRRLTINKDGYVDINCRLVVRGNGSSYNEGIRILPASNGWSNVFFSADTTLSDTHDGGWLIGRRGAAGTVGAVGDFTIEEQSSNGSNLTIHKDSNGATLQGMMRSTVGYQVQRTAGNGYGLGLYGTSAHNSYGIHMSLTSSYSKHGFVQGDWATYFCFDGATNRGWIFKQAGTNVASISGTGGAKFDDTVFSYAYTRSSNKAAFMWDKPGSNYTGMGANGSSDTIQFRACDANGSWVDYKQHWNFYGDLYAYGARFANRGTSTTTSAYSDSAVEIREYNFGGAQSDTWGVAPRLSFHWSGRVAAQIGLASNGNLYINNNAAGSTTFLRIVGMTGYGAGEPSGAAPTGAVYFKYV